MNDGAAPFLLAVPPHLVDAVGGPALLKDDAHRVGEAHGVVRRVAGEQEHVALADHDVLKGPVLVDDLEEHRPLVLVEPLGRLVDVVVCARIGAAYDLGWGSVLVGVFCFPSFFVLLFFKKKKRILIVSSWDYVSYNKSWISEMSVRKRNMCDTHHDGETLIVDAVIIDWRFQEM